MSSLRDEVQKVPQAQLFRQCCKASTEVHELLGSKDNFDILDVSNLSKSQRDWTVRAQVKNLPVDLKVDTGAQSKTGALSTGAQSATSRCALNHFLIQVARCYVRTDEAQFNTSGSYVPKLH
ncbi:hypothetical protein MTO96_025804 [Rhipicephalus appendiculatus]